jgi:hypothetical protein
MTPLQIATLILGFGLELAKAFGLSDVELKSSIKKLLDQTDFASDDSWKEHEKNLEELKDPRGV